LSSEETKNHLTDDKQKRLARMKMERFHCHGWLHIRIIDEDQIMRVNLTHKLGHIKYVDIALPQDVVDTIEWLKSLPAAKVHNQVMMQFKY